MKVFILIVLCLGFIITCKRMADFVKEESSIANYYEPFHWSKFLYLGGALVIKLAAVIACLCIL